MVCIPCIFAPVIPLLLILWKFIQPFFQSLGWIAKKEIAEAPVAGSTGTADTAAAASGANAVASTVAEEIVAGDSKKDD